MNYLYEHNSIIHLINNLSDGLEYLYMLISNDDTNYNKYENYSVEIIFNTMNQVPLSGISQKQYYVNYLSKNTEKIYYKLTDILQIHDKLEIEIGQQKLKNENFNFVVEPYSTEPTLSNLTEIIEEQHLPYKSIITYNVGSSKEFLLIVFPNRPITNNDKFEYFFKYKSYSSKIVKLGYNSEFDHFQFDTNQLNLTIQNLIFIHKQLQYKQLAYSIELFSKNVFDDLDSNSMLFKYSQWGVVSSPLRTYTYNKLNDVNYFNVTFSVPKINELYYITVSAFGNLNDGE